MTIHPHIRELLRFEVQRLGTPIDHDGGDDVSPSVIALRGPRPGTLFESHSISISTDAPTAVRLTHLPGDDAIVVPGVDGPLPVAQRVGNVVTLAFELSEVVEPDSRAVFRHLWDEIVVPALTSAAEHVREHGDRERLEALARIEEQVWRQMLQRLPGEIENLEYAVTRLEGQMREQLSKLADLRRQHRAVQLIMPDAVRQSAHEQHAALRRLVPNVYRSVELRGSQILASIGPIVLEDDAAEVAVGTFEVSVSLDSAQVAITNKTNVTNGIHHPHVRSPQEICWGNVRTGITRLIADREWAGLLTVIARFLNSYAESDAYQKLAAWDPDRSEEDDENDDEESDDDDTTECVICLERCADDDITTVRDEPVCPTCLERDCFECARCQRQFTSREQARASSQCTSCWEASRTDAAPPQAEAVAS